MTRMIGKLSDRLLALVAPKAEAEAAVCDICPCREVFCYCQGPRYYTKTCARTPGGSHCCNPCRSLGFGC